MTVPEAAIAESGGRLPKGEEIRPLQQPFVNVFGAASSCAETARSLFPLELAVKGGFR